MQTPEEHEAAFGQGFDVAIESSKEALDMLRERIQNLESALTFYACGGDVRGCMC